MDNHKLEVGQQIELDGRNYWISRIQGDTLELMPDPDNLLGRKSQGSFWPTFFVIILLIVLIRLVL